MRILPFPLELLALVPHNLGIASASPKRRARASVTRSAESARTDSRLGRIVRLLLDNAMVVVSGTKIADEIGTSRSEVWRLVEQLRSLGVEIAGHPHTGYRLEKVPDLLLPEVVAPLVRGTLFGTRIQHYYKIGSTNSEAMQAAQAGEPEGSVFLAEEQTAGRGRGGHDWSSARSQGIYCSVVVRPQLAPAEVLLLSLAAGLAVEAAVKKITGLTADLRWPNDLLLDEKKFCGILIEMNAEATRVRYAVVGIGINVNHERFSGELSDVATSLRLHSGRPWSRVELAAALLQSLDREYRLLTSGEPDARQQICKRFEEASSYARGRMVTVEENGGYEGVTEGLDERGFLQVRTFAPGEVDGCRMPGMPELRTVLSGGVRALRH